MWCRRRRRVDGFLRTRLDRRYGDERVEQARAEFQNSITSRGSTVTADVVRGEARGRYVPLRHDETKSEAKRNRRAGTTVFENVFPFFARASFFVRMDLFFNREFPPIGPHRHLSLIHI